MKSLIITLSVIGIVSALALTFVYEWTTPYIEANQAKAQKQAINEVLPGVEEVKEVEKDNNVFMKAMIKMEVELELLSKIVVVAIMAKLK